MQVITPMALQIDALHCNEAPGHSWVAKLCHASSPQQTRNLPYTSPSASCQLVVWAGPQAVASGRAETAHSILQSDEQHPLLLVC